MSEEPKRIWVARDKYVVDPDKSCERTLEYIRADLVDDLAELLRLLYIRNFPLTKTMREGIVAALEQLEDHHD